MCVRPPELSLHQPIPRQCAESYLSADLATAFRKATGIAGSLYQWQADCLMAPGVLSVRDLAPGLLLVLPDCCVPASQLPA